VYLRYFIFFLNKQGLGVVAAVIDYSVEMANQVGCGTYHVLSRICCAIYHVLASTPDPELARLRTDLDSLSRTTLGGVAAFLMGVVTFIQQKCAVLVATHGADQAAATALVLRYALYRQVSTTVSAFR
jgi:hypothetical protein